MNIDLYVCTSKKDTVKKVLTEENIVTGCKLMDSTSILNPTVIFRAGAIVDFLKYNYCKIPQFGRYYYITNKTFNNNTVTLNMEVDPIYSWYDTYKNTSQLISRSESIRNRYIQDGSEPIHSDNFYTYVNFGIDVFDKKCDRLILTTAGKGSLAEGSVE